MKSKLMIFLVGMMIAAMTTNAFASSFITQNAATGEIRVEGTVSEAAFNQTVTIQVLNPDQTPAQIAGVEAGTGALANIAAVVTDKDGKFQYIFKMNPENTTGEYTVRIGAYDKTSPYTETFSFVNQAEIEALFQEVSALHDAVMIQQKLNVRNMKILGLTNAFFSQLPVEVCQKIADNPYEDIAGLQNIAFAEMAVQALKKTAVDTEKVKKVFNVYPAYMNLPAALLYPEYQRFIDEPNTGLQKIDSVFAGFINSQCNSIPEIRTKFDQLVTLELIANAADYGEVDRILNHYWSVLEIDLTSQKYTGLKEPGRVSADLVGRRFGDIGSFGTAFLNAVDAEIEREKPGVREERSGGGGGGGRVISADIIQNVTTPPVTDADIVFSDMDTTPWALEAIRNLARQKIIDGDEAGKFRPNDNITREEFIKIIASAFQLTPDSSDELSFTDARQDGWYRQYLAAAKKTGIINGRADGSFGIGENITRQDMAVILYRVAKYASREMKINKQEVVFKDQTDIDGYAIESVSALQQAGVINGMDDGSFAPRNNATRAEACVMVNTLLTGGILP